MLTFKFKEQINQRRHPPNEGQHHLHKKKISNRNQKAHVQNINLNEKYLRTDTITLDLLLEVWFKMRKQTKNIIKIKGRSAELNKLFFF